MLHRLVHRLAEARRPPPRVPYREPSEGHGRTESRCGMPRGNPRPGAAAPTFRPATFPVEQSARPAPVTSRDSPNRNSSGGDQAAARPRTSSSPFMLMQLAKWDARDQSLLRSESDRRPACSVEIHAVAPSLKQGRCATIRPIGGTRPGVFVCRYTRVCGPKSDSNGAGWAVSSAPRHRTPKESPCDSHWIEVSLASESRAAARATRWSEGFRYASREEG